MNTGRVIYATGGSSSLDQFGIFDGIGIYFGGVYQNISANYPKTNVWSHLAASRIGSTIRMYINGTQTSSGTQSGSIGSSSAIAYVGARGADSEHHFKGNIAVVRIYKGKGLTASEILQNYNAQRNRFGL